MTRIITHGTVIVRHRESLGLTREEYAVLARCSPVEIVDTERSHRRLSSSSIARLAVYGLGVVEALASPSGKPGASSGRGSCKGNPWKDISFEHHARARKCADSPMTLHEIGLEMGLTDVSVSNIEHEAMRKIRKKPGNERVVELLELREEHATQHPLSGEIGD